MGKAHNSETLILAIYPTALGFGFAVFEGRHRLIDWGFKGAEGDKNRRVLAKTGELLAWYKPDALVLEDTRAPTSRRSDRIKQLHRELQKLGTSAKVIVRQYARPDIKGVFDIRGASTRYEIAQAISEEVPELAPSFPPPRKIWKKEDPRLSIFDAASLAITHFEIKRFQRHTQSAS